MQYCDNLICISSLGIERDFVARSGLATAVSVSTRLPHNPEAHCQAALEIRWLLCCISQVVAAHLHTGIRLCLIRTRMLLTAAVRIMRCSIRARSRPTQFFGPAARSADVDNNAKPSLPLEKGCQALLCLFDSSSQRSGLNLSASSQLSEGDQSSQSDMLSRKVANPPG